MKKKAFTLAEVLITLGIIGVVAAMTLPTVINKAKGKELESQYKKAYAVLSQALTTMNAQQGFVANFNNYTPCTTDFADKFNKYFLSYVDCGKNGCSTFTEDDNYLSKYKTYNGKSGSAIFFDDGQFITADTMFVSINHCILGNKITIAVDVNGINKRPNRYGHDFFVFQIMDDGKLVPLGTKGTIMTGAGYNASTSPDSFCSLTSSSTVNGITCAYFASTDNSFFTKLPR